VIATGPAAARALPSTLEPSGVLASKYVREPPPISSPSRRWRLTNSRALGASAFVTMVRSERPGWLRSSIPPTASTTARRTSEKELVVEPDAELRLADRVAVHHDRARPIDRAAEERIRVVVRAVGRAQDREQRHPLAARHDPDHAVHLAEFRVGPRHHERVDLAGAGLVEPVVGDVLEGLGGVAARTRDAPRQDDGRRLRDRSRRVGPHRSPHPSLARTPAAATTSMLAPVDAGTTSRPVARMASALMPPC